MRNNHPNRQTYQQLSLDFGDSTFLIEPFDLSPNSTIDPTMSAIDPEKVKDWPMVYILGEKNPSREKNAYVGQTTRAQKRMKEHMSNPARHIFDEVNLIFSPSFNQSVITDYERRLIQLLGAQGNYKLHNKNDGLSNSNYFQREEYDELFQQLWQTLLQKGIADKTIDEIESSSLFKYSPYKSLNPEQELAFEDILAEIKKIDENPHPLVVQGMPGTGKTILAVYLLKALKDSEEFKDKNVKLLEPIPSLRKTLSDVVKNIQGLDKDDIIGPSDLAKAAYGFKEGEKGFDVVLVDEAHRLRQYKNISDRKTFKDTAKALGFENPEETTQFDWILSQSKIPIFFYDPSQIVKPSSPDTDYFKGLLGNDAARPIHLTTQMRIKEGKRYLEHIYNVLFGNQPEPFKITDYDFRIYDDYQSFNDAFERVRTNDSLTRMIAGFAWKWKNKGKKKGEIKEDEIVIDGINRYWNCTQTGWVDKGFDNEEVANEVGCIHTIQGYDLSQAFVILGKDIKYDPETDSLIADRSNYFDTNGKNKTTDEELTTYIRNIYYVLLTRGVNGTHIYAVDPAVRDYLRRFFQ